MGKEIRVGDIVLYRMPTGTRLPAVVTAVHNDTTVNLGVFGLNYSCETSVLRGDSYREWQFRD